MQTKETKQKNPQPGTKLKPWLYGLIGFFLGAVTYFGITTYVLSSSRQKGINTELLSKVESIVKQKYDGEIDMNKLSEGAAAGAVAALGDPYTSYLDKKANQELANDLKGELSGIGIEVGQKNGKLTVIAPIDGTPADKAGLKAGDYIASVDGVDSSTLTIDEAVNRIRGEKGTDVKLVIVRGSNPPKEVTITRDLINVPSVSYELKDGIVGYIKIRRFGEDTATLVMRAGESLRAQGAKGLIIDVRDNPGGYLETAVEVASQFMNSGLVVEERSTKAKTKVHNAIAGGKLTDLPVVVLVNGGSASASEILAGALSDNGKAILIGDKTYGKGSVQEVICLDGSSLFSQSCDGPTIKVTVAHWYTPKGVNISKEGIKPNIEVKLSEEDYKNGLDPQLQRALEEIKKSIK